MRSLFSSCRLFIATYQGESSVVSSSAMTSDGFWTRTLSSSRTAHLRQICHKARVARVNLLAAAAGTQSASEEEEESIKRGTKFILNGLPASCVLVRYLLHLVTHFVGVTIALICSWVNGTNGEVSGFDVAAAGLSPVFHHFAWYGTP